MNATGRMKKLKINQPEGFAIIEALVAMAIFAIVMLAVISMQTKAVQTNDIARGVTEQTALAAEQMERLVALPFTHPDLTGNHTAPAQGRYTIAWTVAANAMIDNTKTVTITVTWQEASVQKSVNLTFIRAM